MTVLDKYLVKKFIINLAFSISAFVIIFLVVDLMQTMLPAVISAVFICSEKTVVAIRIGAKL